MTSRTCCGSAAVVALALAAVGLTACAPSLDWREMRAEASGVQLLFPCRPAKAQRRVPLGGQMVTLHLMSCSAGGQTWGLAHADVEEPARVDAALAALLASAANNVGANGAGAVQPAVPDAVPQPVPGATPQPRSGRLRLEGRLPDGRAVRMQALVFAHGTVVHQASAVGEMLPEEAVETFMASVRFQAP